MVVFQQSRFLALVGDYSRLSELMDIAANSEDTSMVQTLKTMDSLETKIQNVKNAFQGFYANLGLETVFKGVLDIVTNVINRLNDLPKMFDKIPIAAIAIAAQLIGVIKNIAMTALALFTAQYQKIYQTIKDNIVNGYVDGSQEGINRANQIAQQQQNSPAMGGQQTGKEKVNGKMIFGRVLQTVGTGLMTKALTMGGDQAEERGIWEAGSAVASALGSGLTTFAMTGSPIMAGISALFSAIPGVVAAIDDWTHAEEKAIAAAKEKAEQSKQDAIIAKNEAKNLDNDIKKLEQLTEARFDSNEAYQEWIDFRNQMADNYPELIAMYDAEGNAVINTADAYDLLAKKRQAAAREELIAKNNQLQASKDEADQVKKKLEEARESTKTIAGDEWGLGLANLNNLTAFFTAYTGEFKASSNLGELSQEFIQALFGISDEYMAKLSQKAKDTWDRVELDLVNFGLDLDNLDEIKKQAESNGHAGKQVLGDLAYENYIKPLASTSFMQNSGYDLETIKSTVASFSELYKNEDGTVDTEAVENATYEYYMGILQALIDRASRGSALQTLIDQNNQRIAEIDNNFAEKIEQMRQTNNYDNIALGKMMNDDLAKGLYQQKSISFQDEGLEINSTEFEEQAADFREELYNFYTSVSSDTWKQLTSLLSNPGQYTSKEGLISAVTELIGPIDGDIESALLGYVEQVWSATNEDLQSTFQAQMRAHYDKADNKRIANAAVGLSKLGNDLGSDEIAADNLEAINKQWVDLVGKQKNEAVATSNAEFLSNIYSTTASMGDEVNNAITDILTTAELDTKDGVQAAIDAINAYTVDADLDDGELALLKELLGLLQIHKENILSNLNTEISSYVGSLSDSAKALAQVHTDNTTGFDDLSDMQKKLDTINAERKTKGQELFTFDDLFTFNASLNKFTYTAKGFNAASASALSEASENYETVSEQLKSEQTVLARLTNADLSSFSDEEISQALKNISLNANSSYTEQQRNYIGQLVDEWNKLIGPDGVASQTWEEFLAAHQEELEKQGISLDQAKAAYNQMTKEAQQRAAFNNIDFAGIAKGEVKFEDVRQAMLDYYASRGLLFGDDQTADNYLKMQFEKWKAGGLTSAENYKAMAGESFDPKIYNELLNAPSNALKTLGETVKNAVKDSEVQLTDAERNLLGLDESVTSIPYEELVDKYSELMGNLTEAVKNTSLTIKEANAVVLAQSQFSNETKAREQVEALKTVSLSGDITLESIETLANAMGGILRSDFDWDKIDGIEVTETGEKVVTDAEEFLKSLNKQLEVPLPENKIDEIAKGLDVIDESKIKDAMIQSENTIVDGIANNISSLSSNLTIGKQINLTFLQKQIGDDKLSEIFGEAYKNGILTVDDIVKANMYSSLKEVRAALKREGEDTTDLDKTLKEYITSASSELAGFYKNMTLSDNTASLLASASEKFKSELESTDKITLNSAEEYLEAARLIYQAVAQSYQDGITDLNTLNSNYLSLINANNAKQTAGLDMLTSATSLTADSLNTFMTSMGYKLSSMLNEAGDVVNGWANSITRTGINSYEITNWDRYIGQLERSIHDTIDKTTEEYINAYTNWIENQLKITPTNLSSLQSQGTTSISDMLKRAGDINRQLGTDYDLSAIFEYDQTVHGFVYNTEGLLASITALNSQLDFLSGDELWAAQQLINDAKRQFADAIDVSGFLNLAIGDPARDLKIDELRNAIEDYNTALTALGEKEGLNAQTIIEALRYGGENAVRAAEMIADLQEKTLSASDVEAAYRSQISNFVNAIDTVTAMPGAIVDTITANLIRDNGGRVNELGNTGQYVVESAANLYEAYKDLLERMRRTGEATLADLNKVAALAFSNRDGEQVAIDSLGDAAGMTFERFGEILAQAGYQLTEEVIDAMEAAGIINLMGGNKMRIADFSAFADLMGWEPDSEEYVSAFKTYNDSLIDMNRKAERNILEEAQALGDAKSGDWLNLTQLSSELSRHILSTESFEGKEVKFTALDELANRLSQYGAFLQDGILKLGDNANIPAIIQTIANYASQYGGLLEADMAALADTLDSVLNSYVDAIKKGISGTLTNSEALDLQDMVDSLGMDVSLNFTQTTEGLKLSQQAAIDLYQELLKIDGLKAQLVFDEMYDSLTGSGSGLENVTQTFGRVAEIQRRIKANEEAIHKAVIQTGSADTPRVKALAEQNAKLREQLQLLGQIQAKQMDDPSSYNFMDNALPSYMQGAQNYWDSIGKAYKSMNEAGQSGYMSIQDFRNIVNEMNNMAALTGSELEFMGQTLDGSMESASAAIQAGMSHLENIDGSGVKINLNNFGLDISSGAEGMQKGFHEGIKAVAQSQIEMIDAAINLLEVIVAMEKLGDIDVDNNGKLDFGEIFEIDENGDSLHKFTAYFDSTRKEILDIFEKSDTLKPLLNNILINGVSINDLLTKDVEQLKDLNLTEEEYAQIMAALYEAAMSDDYSLDGLMTSIQSVLSKTGQVFEYFDEANNKSYIIDINGAQYAIDWNSDKQVDKIKDALDKAGYKGPTDPETLRKLMADAAMGKETEPNLQFAYKLAMGEVTELKNDPDGNQYKYNGKTYKDEQSLTQAIVKNDAAARIGGTINAGESTSEVTTVETEHGFKMQVLFDENGNPLYRTPDGATFDKQDNAIKHVQDQAAEAMFNQNYDKLSEGQRKQVDIAVGLEAKPTISIEGNFDTPEVYNKALELRNELAKNAEQDWKQVMANNKIEIQDNGDGTITIDPSGMKVVVPENAANEEIQTAIEKALGIDNIINGVAIGIKQAFTEDTTISDAIGQGITAALLGGTSDTTGTEPIDMSNVTLNITGTPTIKSDGMETLTIDSVTADVTELTLNPTNAPTLGSEDTTLTIDSVSADVASLTLNPVGSPIVGTEGTTTTVDSINADVNEMKINAVANTSFTSEITSEIAEGSANLAHLKIDSVSNATYDQEVKVDDIAEGSATVNNLKISATGLSADGGLARLQGLDFSTTSTNLLTLRNRTRDISGATFGNFSTLSDSLGTVAQQAETVWETVKQFANQTFTVNMNTSGGGDVTTNVTENKTTNETHNITETKTVNEISNSEINVDTSGAQKNVQAFGTSASTAGVLATAAAGKIKSMSSAISAIPNKSGVVSSLASAIRNIPDNASRVSALANAMRNIPSGTTTQTIKFSYTVGRAGATGNAGGFARAKGKGPALAGGRKTLMGELGPELVVSNGRYFLVGQNGAEFVNLAKDAIVFNHKQTKRLMEQGAIGSRGKAFTNENNAISLAKGRIPEYGDARSVPPPSGGGSPAKTPEPIREEIKSVSVSPTSSEMKLYSFAKGSVSGPAMASAAAALAALKELRAMWQSMLDASAQQLGSQAGRGGGGGGGGCFAAGTPIAMQGYYKNIENIQKGDIVLSYNETTGQNEYSEVLQTMIHIVQDKIYTICVENEQLVATGIHRFFVIHNGECNWIPASELQIGDLMLFADSTWHEIHDILVEVKTLTVYNFEVSNNHNYYVGTNSILAHNKGGGGGGGGGDEEFPYEILTKTVTEQIERWYNLLRKIDKLEKDITYQESLRKKYETDRIANGEKIYSTYQKNLANLQDEIANQKELVSLQKSWYDAKRQELAKSNYGKIFTYDENGLQQYVGTGKPGSGQGLDILEQLTRRDAKGNPIGHAKNAGTQLAYLKSLGFSMAELRINEDGTKLMDVLNMTSEQIKNAIARENGSDPKDVKQKDIEQKKQDVMVQMMQNFWDNVDGWRDDLDSLYDSYNDSLNDIEENQVKQNEILQQLVDNELSVEQDIYKAIEAREQASIDRLKEEKEALQDASDAFINGLSDNLKKQQEMYNKQQSQNEITKLQRQLAILQRSGGSASQIRSIQSQLDSKLQQQAFDEQQAQIDAVQEASTKQIEKLDTQISLMEDNLDYQKAHGLLWTEVREIMKQDDAVVIAQLLAWNPEYQQQSQLDLVETLKDIRERFQIWASDRDTNEMVAREMAKFDQEKTAQTFANANNKTYKDLTKEGSDYSKLGNGRKAKVTAAAESASREAYESALKEGKTTKEAKSAAQEAYYSKFKSEAATQLSQARAANAAQKQKDRTAAIADYKKNSGQKIDLNSEYKQWLTRQKQLSAIGESTIYDTSEFKNNSENFKNAYLDARLKGKNIGEALQAAMNKINVKVDPNSLKLEKDTSFYTLKTVKGKETMSDPKTFAKGTQIKVAGTKTVDGKDYFTISANGKTYYALQSAFSKATAIKASLGKNINTFGEDDKTVKKAKNKLSNFSINGLGKGKINSNQSTDKGVSLLTKEVKNGQYQSVMLKADTPVTVESVTGYKRTSGAFTKATISKVNGKELKNKLVLTYSQIDDTIKKSIKNAYDPRFQDYYKAIHKQKNKAGGKYHAKVNGTAYKTGGMADFTGPAWLDGTKRAPEAVLNAEQTRFLREDLLGNSNMSLMSIVTALQDTLHNTGASSINNSDAITIEHITLNFESGVISNDYSARRAGDMAMQEIVKIARKVGNNSVSRR